MLRGIVLVVALLVAPAAWAQGLDLSQIQDVARAKAEEGLALYQEKRWAEAYDRFLVAEELFHAPTLVMFMGHCKRELGELLAARALYKRLADEQLPAEAPPAFVEAQGTARAALADLDARIPRVSVVVTGAPAARISLDGAAIGAYPAEVEVDPGRHRLQVTAKETEGYDEEIVLAEGERKRVDVALKAIAPRIIVAPAPPPPPPEPGTLVPAAVCGAVAVAGFALGAVAGGIVLDRVATIRDRCDGDVCPASLEAEAEDIRPIARASTAGFVIGGASLAAAVVLFAVRPGGGWVAAVGAGSLSLRGAF
jgi:hypothetical protein